jgi:hypothetical protein
MRLIHDLSGLSGQVKSSRRGSSGVDRDAGDGEIVTLQNHAYQLCDEIRCDTICDFRTLLRKYEQSQGRLFSYSKRRVYSYESSVQSGVDKKKKNGPEPSPSIATHCCSHTWLCREKKPPMPQWHGCYRRVEIHTVLCCWCAQSEGKMAVMVSRCLIDVISSQLPFTRRFYEEHDYSD